MAKAHVLAIGFGLPNVDGFDEANIDSERSLLDADIIAVRPTLKSFYADDEYQGSPCLSQSASVSFREILQRWPSQLKLAIEAGKTLVFFLPKKNEMYYYTGEKSVSGTGRSQQTTNFVSNASNFSFLPVQLQSMTVATGLKMKLDSGAEVISSFWTQFSDVAKYHCTFDLKEGWRKLVLTKSGDLVVGAMVAKGIFLLPDISFDHIDDVKRNDDGEPICDEDGQYIWSDEKLQASHRLRDALVALHYLVRGDKADTPPPDWTRADQYRLAEETPLEEAILRVGLRIGALEEERAALRAELERKGRLRHLLFGKSHELEEAVRLALSILGFSTDHFKSGDSEFDALFSDSDGRYLGEVEGKDNKAINVDKLSQLQRNVLEDLSRDEISEPAIGVLFGNGFRLKPPQERDACFTTKVIAGAAISSVSLVNTIDLFQVAKYVLESGDGRFATECRSAIRRSVGQIVVFPTPPTPDNEMMEASPTP